MDRKRFHCEREVMVVVETEEDAFLPCCSGILVNKLVKAGTLKVGTSFFLAHLSCTFT
jgi:hypothetical protein